MPTLKAIIHGNISVELEYTVLPGEAPSHDCPGCDAEIEFSDEPGDQVMIVDNPDDVIEIGQPEFFRIDIELGDDLSQKEWDRLEQLAWESYNNQLDNG